MKAIVIAIAAAMSMTEARACPELASLTKRYGISFSGFDTPIPAVKAPPAADGGKRLRLPVAQSHIVSDGFRHTVLFDTATRKAWILRTGGFAGVYEWYGPVDAGDAKLENCRTEPEPVVQTAGKD